MVKFIRSVTPRKILTKLEVLMYLKRVLQVETKIAMCMKMKTLGLIGKQRCLRQVVSLIELYERMMPTKILCR